LSHERSVFAIQLETDGVLIDVYLRLRLPLFFAKKTVVFPDFKLYANNLDVWLEANKSNRDVSCFALVSLDDRSNG
jgi:hypothetical protein